MNKFQALSRQIVRGEIIVPLEDPQRPEPRRPHPVQARPRRPLPAPPEKRS
jgi:hypothetical protein